MRAIPFVVRLFLIGAVVSSIPSSALADVDPAQVADDAAEQASEAVAPEEAYAPASTGSSALAQFPQAETAAPVAAQAQVASAASLPASATDGAFPKVQTAQDEELARKFAWWPSDAQPAPYKDPDRSGYWWWPEKPGSTKIWGNQGYVYVKKLIFDYKNEVVETPQGPMKPSLVIKRILRNVKVYFDYDKADLRDDAIDLLNKALYTLRNNPKADILITGNADVRGSEQYNVKLGERRAATVQKYLTDNGLAPERIRILSRGKLDALAPKGDLVGMQKDRNAQFMIAEVEEVMIPAEKASLFETSEIEEKEELTGEIRVGSKEYTIQSGDTLWAIAEREYGDGRQWKRIYEFNKDVISNPNRPRKGTRIQIPQE